MSWASGTILHWMATPNVRPTNVLSNKLKACEWTRGIDRRWRTATEFRVWLRLLKCRVSECVCERQRGAHSWTITYISYIHRIVRSVVSIMTNLLVDINGMRRRSKSKHKEKTNYVFTGLSATPPVADWRNEKENPSGCHATSYKLKYFIGSTERSNSSEKHRLWTEMNRLGFGLVRGPQWAHSISINFRIFHVWSPLDGDLLNVIECIRTEHDFAFHSFRTRNILIKHFIRSHEA